MRLEQQYNLILFYYAQYNIWIESEYYTICSWIQNRWIYLNNKDPKRRLIEKPTNILFNSSCSVASIISQTFKLLNASVQMAICEKNIYMHLYNVHKCEVKQKKKQIFVQIKANKEKYGMEEWYWTTSHRIKTHICSQKEIK